MEALRTWVIRLNVFSVSGSRSCLSLKCVSNKLYTHQPGPLAAPIDDIYAFDRDYIWFFFESFALRGIQISHCNLVYLGVRISSV